jgi:ribose-phosphate pyrophosphokinase
MLTLNGVPVESFKFPAGESMLAVKPSVSMGDTSIVEWDYESDEEFFQLSLLVDIIRRNGGTDIELVVPYMPHGRQDRVMKPGDPLSIRVACDLINTMNFSRVITLDDHSSVVSALLNNHYPIDRLYILASFPSVMELLEGGAVIISPDAGAQKTNDSIAKEFSVPHLCASKTRDVTTGNIIGVVAPEVQGKVCLIVDDICDGGRTFIELSKALRANGATEVYLYVTHGIFSKGVDIFDGLIDGVFVANMINQVEGVEVWSDMSSSAT